MEEKEDNRGIVVLLSILLIIVIGAVLALLFLNHTAISSSTISQSSNSSSNINISSDSSSSSQESSEPVAVINSPVEGQTLNSDLIELSGQAEGLFENTLNFRVVQDDGKEIYVGTVFVPNSDTSLSDFFMRFNINISTITSTSGEIEAYYVSPKDGTEIILATVPIAFAQP